jgi:hypothetical protein
MNPRDLNTLIDPLSGWRLHTASDINSQGQIIGFGTNSVGSSQGFLLTPLVDTSMPPETTIVTAEDGFGNLLASGNTSLSTSMTFSIIGTDDRGVAGFECSLDGEIFLDCSSPETIRELPFGVHTFEVRAVDIDANFDPTPASFVWEIITPSEGLLADSDGDGVNDGDEEVIDAHMNKPIFNDSKVFAKGYVTLGAGAKVTGDVFTGAATTVGVDARVYGTIDSLAATTLGAGAQIVGGDVYSGAATTLGADSVVQGIVSSGGDTTLGANAVKGTQSMRPVSWAEPDVGDLEDAQDFLYGLLPQFEGVTHNIGANETWAPGVYTIDGSLSVSADVIITLNNTNPGDFIINVRDYVSFGAGVKVKWMNDVLDKPRVIWNVTGTYISIGAWADIEGLLLANTYISTGAHSKVKGGAYSTTSYVVAGAKSEIQ